MNSQYEKALGPGQGDESDPQRLRRREPAAGTVTRNYEPVALEVAVSVGLVAFHHPKPEYRDGLVQRVRRAAEVLATVPGCLDVGCWREEATGAVVTTGTWESKDALRAGFAAVVAADVDFDYDDRESRPREVFNLSPA